MKTPSLREVTPGAGTRLVLDRWIGLCVSSASIPMLCRRSRMRSGFSIEYMPVAGSCVGLTGESWECVAGTGCRIAAQDARTRR